MSKAQNAQRFLKMPRTSSGKAFETVSRQPEGAFQARYDWEITSPDRKQKIFLKKGLRKTVA